MRTMAFAQQVKAPTPVAGCIHGRIIDDVLRKDGKRTGKVRCVECGAVFDDPFRGLK